jgi:hypothetical protein
VSIVTTIIDALRKLGTPTQKTALRRQDEQLEGKRVIERPDSRDSRAALR